MRRKHHGVGSQTYTSRTRVALRCVRAPVLRCISPACSHVYQGSAHFEIGQLDLTESKVNVVDATVERMESYIGSYTKPGWYVPTPISNI